MNEAANYALIETGIVVNKVVMRPSIAERYPNAVQSNAAAIGDRYENGVFYHNNYAPEYVAELEAERDELAEANIEYGEALIELYESMEGEL